MAEREKEVQLAGKIGKELLSQTEKLNEANKALEEERIRLIHENQEMRNREAAALRLLESLKQLADEKAAENEVLNEKLGTVASLGLDQTMRQLKADAARFERALEEEKEKYRILLEDYNDLQAKEEILRSQLREAETFTATLETTSEALKKDKIRLINAEEKAERLEKENILLTEQLEEEKSKRLTEEKACEALRQDLRVQSKSFKRACDERMAKEAEKFELQKQLEDLKESCAQELEKLRIELRSSRQMTEQARAELAQSKTEKKKFQEQCLSLAKENQKLYHEQEENQVSSITSLFFEILNFPKNFLDEARRAVRRLQLEMEENHAFGHVKY